MDYLFCVRNYPPLLMSRKCLKSFNEIYCEFIKLRSAATSFMTRMTTKCKRGDHFQRSECFLRHNYISSSEQWVVRVKMWLVKEHSAPWQFPALLHFNGNGGWSFVTWQLSAMGITKLRKHQVGWCLPMTLTMWLAVLGCFTDCDWRWRCRA